MVSVNKILISFSRSGIIFIFITHINNSMSIAADIIHDIRGQSGSSGRSEFLSLQNAAETLDFASKLSQKKCMTGKHRHRVKRQEPNVLHLKDRPPKYHLIQGDDERVSSTTDDGGEGAVYFRYDSDPIIYSGMHEESFHFPRENFTVELWVNPEGGQSHGAVIAELSDKCKTALTTPWGWSLGISTLNPEEEFDARFYFRLQTDRSRTASVIRAHYRYQANRWVYLVATYDGNTMKLYQDGALVGSGMGQRGPIFSSVTQVCKELTIGGSLLRNSPFRGSIDRLSISAVDFTHNHIKNRNNAGFILNSFTFSNASVYDDFNNLDAWKSLGEEEPILESPSFHNDRYGVKIDIPKCGLTVCDNPDLMRRYILNEDLRRKKTIRYRFITIAEDDGSNPTVSSEEIRRQHRFVKQAFRFYQINWQLHEQTVYNSSLRYKLVLTDCAEEKIGNGLCDDGCDFEITGFDGGDCLFNDSNDPFMACSVFMLNDNICHHACNNALFDYDEGDCCNSSVTDLRNCIDPRSPDRAYISTTRFKEEIGLESDTHLNIYLVHLVDEELGGFATYPWHWESLTLYGGTMIQINHLPLNNTIIHELGHNLGLWHTHYGISELSCMDECREVTPSLSLGDLVEDTPPTPENYHCHDPSPGSYRVCDVDERIFTNTLYSNYMSYADGTCTNHFTGQQAARMHCYIDLMYASWRSSPPPPVLPFPPQILQASLGQVTIGWLPSLSNYQQKVKQSLCSSCSDDGTVAQYASRAVYMRNNAALDTFTKHATGPPDAERCKRSTRAWFPGESMDMVFGCENCYLEVDFAMAVLPSRLLLWVSYASKDSIRNVKLVLDNGMIVSLGHIQVFCDVPYTLRLDNLERAITAVRIYIMHPYVHVDAVQIISRPNHHACDECRHQLMYLLERDPPFARQLAVLEHRNFTDSSISPGINYTYTVMVMALVKSNVDGAQPIMSASSPTSYMEGQAFCGNGLIDSGTAEQCDDANRAAGDGCDLDCKVEQYFVCEGVPSLCRYFVDDGICEWFEHPNSWADCGFHTPNGFSDQWAFKAKYRRTQECPIDNLLGPPSTNQKCRVFEKAWTSLAGAWFPCFRDFIPTTHTIKVSFERPVVATEIIIHLAALVDNFYHPVKISVYLIDPNGLRHAKPAANRTLSCEDNPIHFKVFHDLSLPFRYTKDVELHFSNSRFAISGVRLRSSDVLNPVMLPACSAGNMYNPATSRCAPYQDLMQECPDINIRNANVTCSGHQEGDHCYVRCHIGHRPLEQQKAICVGGEWQHLVDISCKPVDCREPFIEHATVLCQEGHTFDRTCAFKCNAPAKLKGLATANTIRCLDDGLFSLPESFCQLLCDAPPVPPFSTFVTKECVRGGLNVGTTCKFRCREGYMSTKMKRGRPAQLLHHKCKSNLTWYGPSCEKITCEPVPRLFKGLYNCSDGFNYGSSCLMICPDSNAEITTQTITCGKNGQWNNDFELCPAYNGQCDYPGYLEEDVHFVCPNGVGIGASCRAICIYSSYDEPGLRRHIDDSPSDVRFMPHPWMYHQGEIECMVNGEWHPDPTMIVCVQPCYEKYLGDGKCQRENNRQYCNWDDGDCCNSTVVDPPVFPIPIDCDEKCRCLDPKATENLGLPP